MEKEHISTLFVSAVLIPNISSIVREKHFVEIFVTILFWGLEDLN